MVAFIRKMNDKNKEQKDDNREEIINSRKEEMSHDE